jgi:hypothetical protein
VKSVFNAGVPVYRIEIASALSVHVPLNALSSYSSLNFSNGAPVGAAYCSS